MPRPFVKVSNHIEDHDGLDGLSPLQKLATIGTLVVALGYCDRERTDGRISAARWSKIGTASTRAALLGRGYVERVGDDYHVVNYLHWQLSRAQIEAASRAGRAGAAARWAEDATSNADRKADRIPPDDANRIADRIATETETDNPPTPLGANRIRDDGSGEFHSRAARRARERDDRATPMPPAWTSPRRPGAEPTEDYRAARAALAKRAPGLDQAEGRDPPDIGDQPPF
jgi:hypothetical protein